MILTRSTFCAAPRATARRSDDSETDPIATTSAQASSGPLAVGDFPLKLVALVLQFRVETVVDDRNGDVVTKNLKIVEVGVRKVVAFADRIDAENAQDIIPHNQRRAGI